MDNELEEGICICQSHIFLFSHVGGNHLSRAPFLHFIELAQHAYDTALNFLDYLIEHGSRVLIVITELATNCVAPILSSSDSPWNHFKLSFVRKKN